MGSDIKSLRIRIRSVDSTLHLTKAMGLVAASKIRRATRTMNQSRPYASAMEDVVSVLRSSPECERTPYMQPAGEGTRLVVIAGDRGLAGGYNANVFRLAATEPDAEVIPIGKRACERWDKPVVSSEKFPAADAKKLADELCRDFLDGKFARLGILYTRYRSMMSQEATLLWVLPLEKQEKGRGRGQGSRAALRAGRADGAERGGAHVCERPAGCLRARELRLRGGGAPDGDGLRRQERAGDDRQPAAAVQPGTAELHHAGDHGDRRRIGTVS